MKKEKENLLFFVISSQNSVLGVYDGMRKVKVDYFEKGEIF